MKKENAIANISKQFALRIIKVCKYLLDKYRGESNNAQSRNDFQSKLNISLKEADETKLWLELIHESGYLTDEEFESVYDDNQKIIATLINIIKKVKEKKE